MMKHGFRPVRSIAASLALSTALLMPTVDDIHAEEQKQFSKDEIQTIIREYILQNPEILLEAQQALEAKQQQEVAAQQQEVLQENAEVLFNSPHQIEFGPADAPHTIVEFFDYNCGFCQRAVGDMQTILESDKDVRFVLKEFPVLGEASLEASRVSLAVGRIEPEIHQQFHMDLMLMDGVKNGERALDLAVLMGADKEALLKEMEDPEIMEAIGEVYELATGLGINGTPSYVAGNEVVFGAVGHEELRSALGKE